MSIDFQNHNIQLLNYFEKIIIWLIIVFINTCYLNNAFSEDEPINTSGNMNIPLHEMTCFLPVLDRFLVQRLCQSWMSP